MEEINVVRKRGGRGAIRVALAYPSLYDAAIKSLSVQMLYFYLNSFAEIQAERFVLRRVSGPEPPAKSLESGQPLKNFDAVVFSVHYEPDYVNIVRLLQAGGVPALAKERRQVVIIGGPPVIANPEPLSEIADVLVVGEIEATMPELVQALITGWDGKGRLLDELSPERGFYVPVQEPDTVLFSYVKRLPRDFHPTAQVQPKAGEAATMIEVSRGCGRRCRFCLEGHLFLPPRFRDLQDVLSIADEGSRANGSDRLVLISLSLFDHPQGDEILEELRARKYKYSTPSLRLESINESRLALIRDGGQRTLSIAPETACPHLGDLLGKPLLEERLVEAAAEARRAGFTSLKLYFMIGVPGGGEGEAEAIVKLVRGLASASGFRGTRSLKLSISVFVPKPHTPLQFFGMEGEDSVRRKIYLLKRGLGGLADIRPYKPAWAYIQCLLSRAGREATQILLNWARCGGGLGGWRRAIRDAGVDTSKYLGRLQPSRALPWARVKTGFTDSVWMEAEELVAARP